MEDKLKNLSRLECLHIKGGDCNYNDSFWSRLGESIGSWIKKEIEAGNNISWDPDNPPRRRR